MIECPSCQAQLNIPTDFPEGKKIRCSRCRSTFRMPTAAQRLEQAARAEALRPVPARPSTPPRKRRLPLKLDGGTLALLLGCLAFGVASVPSLAYLCKGLSAFGLLIALASMLVPALRKRLGNLRFTMGVTVLCLLGLIFLGRWPAFLTPTTSTLEEVALGGGGRRPLSTDKWVDAGASAVQLDGVRVEVVEARVGRAKVKNPGDTSRDLDNVLMITLNVNSTGDRFPYESWAAGGHAPTLTDHQGKEYALRVLERGCTIEGRSSRDYILLAPALKEVLVFTVPAASVEYLRLALPASAFALEGEFRFQIPGSMIANSP